MQRADDEPNAEQRAEVIFANYLTVRETNPDYTAQRLLADHPSLHAELSALLSSDRLIERAIRPKRRGDSTTTRIDAHFGKKVDPNISLDSENDEIAFGAPMSERLKNLRDRGVILDRYVLTEFIEKGGQGAVHKAWDGDLRRHVAIKFLHDVDLESTRSGLPPRLQNRLSRFLEEAQITSQLQHPGIPPVHELGIDEKGRVYFTMKLVRGTSFSKVIDLHHVQGDSRWSLPKLLEIVVRVCETVAFAHARKVIHRDLKPANILVGDYGEAHVMDWGLAKIEGRPSSSDPLARQAKSEVQTLIRSDRSDEAIKINASPEVTPTGSQLGTPQYMSPEQANGDVERIGRHSDVYALGAVLYHVLAGHPPYTPLGSRKSSKDVVDEVAKGPPPRIGDIAPDTAPELASIVEKAMAREPAKRYQSVKELSEDLRAYLDQRVVSAYPTSPFLQLRKWIRKNRLVTGLSLGLALALLAGTAAYAIQQRRQVAVEAERALALELRLDAEKELADFTTLALLAEDDDAAWPMIEPSIPLLRRAIVEAEGVVARQKAKKQSPHDSPTTYAPVDPIIAARRANALAELASRAITIETTSLPNLRQRLSRTEESITSMNTGRAAAWARVQMDLAGDPRFQGVVVAPTPLLCPLRRNPDTGLQEFWHVHTGDPPRVDPRGNISPSRSDATVFTLVPPGTFPFGAQLADPRASNFEPAPAASNLEFHHVSLVDVGAYFIATHEFTNAQWTYATQWMPDIRNATKHIIDRPDDQSLHPVVQVSWREIDTVCRRLGLSLPSEIQWEYAARAGMTSRYWTGDEVTTLFGHANILDHSGRADMTTTDGVDFDDGFAESAPVRSFTANAFGLFDVLGNVGEFTREPITSGSQMYRCYRGGNFRSTPDRCTSAFRYAVLEQNTFFNIGFRPVLLLNPESEAP